MNLSKLDKTSPNIAPLQWPTCNGPVGLADTNSILYFFFLLFDPKLFLFFSIFFIICNHAPFDNFIFKKPGPAISIDENCFISPIRIVLILSAIILGFLLVFFDNISAIFVERSQSKFSGGDSTIILFKI